MTLITRLLLFYLGSLIFLLGGFSTALYLVAQNHLQSQLNERLEGALNTLTAAVEVTPDGVEWEPNERILRFAPGTATDQIAWLVTDGDGRIVARSERPESDDLLAEAAGRLRSFTDTTRRVRWRGERWQAGQRSVFRGETTAPPHEQRPGDPKAVKYPVLVITAALVLEPMRATLHKLTLVLACVSVGALAVAALAGRSVCRRALLPVQNMAADARAVDPNDPDRRIATPNSGDELADLGLAINGLLDRLHESSERQRRFTGDASHQLRTPLAALLGQIEVALRRDRSAEEYREVLATAHSKATHLQRIVESLLYLARADSKASRPQREPLDLCAWMAGHVHTWNDHPRFRDIRLVGAEGPMVLASHPVLLGEIVHILLDNACRYSPSGSDITLTLNRVEGAVRLEISDQGPGIAESDLAHVFTPFFRSTDALHANKDGIGLGLSIARRLAEALGASLIVTSRAGLGSCFVLAFPNRDKPSE